MQMILNFKVSASNKEQVELLSFIELENIEYIPQGQNLFLHLACYLVRNVKLASCFSVYLIVQISNILGFRLSTILKLKSVTGLSKTKSFKFLNIVG